MAVDGPPGAYGLFHDEVVEMDGLSHGGPHGPFLVVLEGDDGMGWQEGTWAVRDGVQGLGPVGVLPVQEVLFGYDDVHGRAYSSG